MNQNQILVFRAPAPVRVSVSDQKSVLLDKGDTITIEFIELRPAGLSLAFDWDVDPLDLPTRYKLNGKEGDVNIFYENDAGQRATYIPDYGWRREDGIAI